MVIKVWNNLHFYTVKINKWILPTELDSCVGLAQGEKFESLHYMYFLSLLAFLSDKKDILVTCYSIAKPGYYKYAKICPQKQKLRGSHQSCMQLPKPWKKCLMWKSLNFGLINVQKHIYLICMVCEGMQTLLCIWIPDSNCMICWLDTKWALSGE